MLCQRLFQVLCFFFFKQKTAYDMRISDWSSDVCSSDLGGSGSRRRVSASSGRTSGRNTAASAMLKAVWALTTRRAPSSPNTDSQPGSWCRKGSTASVPITRAIRSDEHTSELQSLLRNSYAVFCLKKKNNTHTTKHQ